MHCPDCDRILGGESTACTCGWRAQALLAPVNDWLIQQCSVPGCTVMIRSMAGHQASTMPVCKWCQAGKAYYRKATSPMGRRGGNPMDLDEFGRDLYQAIVLRASSVMAVHGAQNMRRKGLVTEAERCERSAQVADAALHHLFDTVQFQKHDVRRILEIK